MTRGMLAARGLQLALLALITTFYGWGALLLAAALALVGGIVMIEERRRVH